MTWDDPNNHDRRQEVRRGGISDDEVVGGPKRKRDKRWCKGKEGRQHRWEYTVIYSWTNSAGDVFEQKRWVCQGCGKQEYGLPKPSPSIPNHKHRYTDTKIESNWWDDREKLYEVCSICGREGKFIYV